MHIGNDIVSTVTHGGNDPINSAARYDAQNTAVFNTSQKEICGGFSGVENG